MYRPLSNLVPLGLACLLAPALVAQSDPAARMLLLGATVVGRDIVAVGERGAILRSGDSTGRDT